MKTKETFKILNSALKILKKDHKPCKDFVLACGNCQHSLQIQMLEDDIAFRKSMEKMPSFKKLLKCAIIK